MVSNRTKIQKARLIIAKYRRDSKSKGIRINWHSKPNLAPVWESLVGYTAADLMARLECRFQPGMSWNNYGEWHIDHIVPITAFNFTTAEDFDFKRCWALNNLQPLWADDNVHKGAKISGHFQPALVI